MSEHSIRLTALTLMPCRFLSFFSIRYCPIESCHASVTSGTIVTVRQLSMRLIWFFQFPEGLLHPIGYRMHFALQKVNKGTFGRRLGTCIRRSLRLYVKKTELPRANNNFKSPYCRKISAVL